MKDIDLKLEELQAFLDQNEIPKIKGKPKTFLGIAKQPHYENVLSNMYAFYFKVNEVHKFNDLFITSFLECIKASKLGAAKETLQTFYDFDVETEFPTGKGGRIDLLLNNREQAIIIENKVYHHLNNDLKDYWSSIEVENKNEDNKIGVVLSLHPISNIKHSHFINITHLQLLNKVMHNLGKYLLYANDKYVVFLKDFYQNIINLSHPLMKKENIAFYFKNKKEINELVVFKKNYKRHIVSEIKKVGQILEGFDVVEPRANTQHNGRLVYYKWKKNNNLMLMVLYEKLLTIDPSLIIVIKMEGELLVNRGVYKKEIIFSEDEKENYADHFDDEKNKDVQWSHFISKEYTLNENDVSNLSGFIQQRLEDDHILSAFRKIETFLDSSKIQRQ
ncbi:PD-(D/E)XK nuclease family protein [Cellulophaga sp. E6(2014)]|uniref:PD-(D/E)XK nuclease family protein n=1 Tax=Cellulophaga sp. E6(2014) TaxID=1495334 RepID=UPI00051DC731|nr:PD-(D/E)XK nuclease family protein [Cellulophaga sp. E6(2014)]KGK30528.1 hypothetical protein EL45_08940 [Cellulophaga sp. E6(2014)]